MNLNKKIISGVLITTLSCATAMPAFAQTSEAISIPTTVISETTEINYSIPQEVLGMDRFLSNSANGTINLNMDAALAAGYDANVVANVKNHLDTINEQVLAGNMVVGENFNAYSVSIVQPSVEPRGGQISETNRGYSGYISTWYGALFIFFDTVETACLIYAFIGTTASCYALIDELNELKNSPGTEFEDDDRQGIDDTLDLMIVAAGTIGQAAVLSRQAVNEASAANKGVSWYIQQDFNTGRYSWAFEAQDHNAIEDLIEQHNPQIIN